MIWLESENTYKWRFNKMQTLAIHWFELKITTSTALLTPFLRHKLNPLLITLVACKDIPAKSDPKFKPIFARLQFVDNQSFKTVEMPQQRNCKFDQKHVFLLGRQDPTLLREMLSTNLVKAYLHDCEEFVSEGSDANFSVGLAQFSFRDFLRPFCK